MLSRRNPMPTTLAVAGVLMLAVLAGAMAWTTYRNYRTIETIQHREMQIQDLRGQILYLDEVLTDSCSLAAVTGEARWEARYRKHLPELDAAIDQVTSLVPDAKAELTEVDEANKKLCVFEDDAFNLVRQGKSVKAWELLNGADYRRYKGQYAEGLAKFSNRLKSHSDSTVQAARDEAMWFLIAALCLGGLVVLILAVGFYSLFRVLRLRSVVSSG